MDNSLTNTPTIIHRICDGLEKFLQLIMICSMVLLSLLMFCQVILRYVFNSPFTGIEEVSLLLGVWVYFSGIAYATKVKEHISGGVIHLIIKKEKHIQYIKLFGYLISLVALLFFSYLAIEYVLKIYDRGRLSANLSWPRWIWSASMVLGFTLSSLYLFIDIYKDFRGIFQKGDK